MAVRFTYSACRKSPSKIESIRRSFNETITYIKNGLLASQQLCMKLNEHVSDCNKNKDREKERQKKHTTKYGTNDVEQNVLRTKVLFTLRAPIQYTLDKTVSVPKMLTY